MKFIIIILINYYIIDNKQIIISQNNKNIFNNLKLKKCIYYNNNYHNIINKYTRCINNKFKKTKLKEKIFNKCIGKNHIKISKNINIIYNKIKNNTISKLKIYKKNITVLGVLPVDLINKITKSIKNNNIKGICLKTTKGIKIIESVSKKDYSILEKGLLDILEALEICSYNKSIFINLIYNNISNYVNNIFNNYYNNKNNLSFDKDKLITENNQIDKNYKFDLKNNKNKYIHKIKLLPWDDEVNLKLKYKIANQFINEKSDNKYNIKSNSNELTTKEINDQINQEFNYF